ncbi:hypothetical protein NQZ68_003624 [Dissostichus eleginoides]|nr:hypothetical protein NQZ68_003624 [Dissostichus eleginoides]
MTAMTQQEFPGLTSPPEEHLLGTPLKCVSICAEETLPIICHCNELHGATGRGPSCDVAQVKYLQLGSESADRWSPMHNKNPLIKH